MIHYITPYSTENNIGKAYNEAIDCVPDEGDWVVLRDGDTMFLTPNWGRVIEENLKLYGGEYALLGAKTNRIGVYHHKVDGMFDRMDIRDHFQMALNLETVSRNKVQRVGFDIAGFFMAFQKKTWTAVGGFPENTPVFDRIFTRKVRQIEGKVGIMEGLYLFHCYRIWSDTPENETSHLYAE